MKEDIEIARSVEMRPILQIAESLNISEDAIELYGRYKAKLSTDLIDSVKIDQSNLILVTAITPTPAGEGKTTTSIGLTDGLRAIGKKSIAVLREPSLGPVFGIKGGAAGGGYSQVIPMEDINLHFTGDFSAIEKANNLLAALIDNNIQNKHHNLNIDPRTIIWKRVMDMNDRALRDIVIGLGGTGNGLPRQGGFNITPASEVMAILCMSADLEDLKKRLGNILVAFTYDKKPVYARDLKAEDAMTILLKDAIKPNLVQTLEHNPVIIHGGPFANIAQGTNTIIATKMGLSLCDYVVTEAGFGADLGAEKFLNIKCVSGGLKPKAVVLVATVRALRHHGGVTKDMYDTPNLEAVQRGICNLEKHIENIKKFGITPVVSINHFPTDSIEEIQFIQSTCQKIGIQAVVSKGFAEGGEGCTELAEAVVHAIHSGTNEFKALYDWSLSIQDKIKIIATQIYGATEVNYTTTALRDLRKIQQLNLENLPVCMAKTQKSFSDNPKKIGRPTGFEITVREFEYAVGAGFVIPILGNMMRMPGLPSVPASEGMTIDKHGVISGLS